MRPAGAPPRLVGHKGAATLADANTLASFDAALAAHVDMIEFDVVSEHPDGSGPLLVAHDHQALRHGPRLTLEDALEHLCNPDFAGIELDVDVKLPGYGLRVLDALRNAGAVERTLLSGMYTGELQAIRASESALRLGWSVPRVRRDYTTDLLTAVPALALLSGYRALLPRRARRALSSMGFDAIMAHWRVVTPALVRAVAACRGELYVWTVDDQERMGQLGEMGVDAIITNDPRTFARAFWSESSATRTGSETRS